VQPLWKAVMGVPQKTKNRPTKRWSNTTPRHITQRNVSQDTIESLAQPCLLKLFTIAKLWKQCVYIPHFLNPFIGCRASRLFYLLFAGKWMELEIK
jgi:hypothetical protein